jgi:hypothetical protein
MIRNVSTDILYAWDVFTTNGIVFGFVIFKSRLSPGNTDYPLTERLNFPSAKVQVLPENHVT